MSALTDLFSALANKIRSKTGGSTTYTPPQMVEAIDDVYAAGYSDGGGGATSITPSNASPAAMTGGTAYKPTANGYAISSYNSITPSSSSPPSMSSGNIYKPSSSGYAIDSYSSISPSESGTYFSSGMKKMSSSGYAYSSQPGVCKTGSVTLSTSSTTKVTLGFKPKYLALRITNNSESNYVMNIYDERYSTSASINAGTNTYMTNVALNGTTQNRLKSIDSDGFTINKTGSSSYTKLEYFAIG